MPITGADLATAAAIFRDHLNEVLRRTVTKAQLTRLMVPGPRAILSFRQGRPPRVEAQLSTRFGLMWLYLGQTCVSSVRADGLHVLRTVSYRYTIRPDGMNKPLFRWEYEKDPGNPYCRHHFQGPITVPIKHDTEVSLNDLHVPTGFVTVEEILRFCIVDLGVPPLSPATPPPAPAEPGDHDLRRQKTWDEVLTESHERFKGDFAPRGQL